MRQTGKLWFLVLAGLLAGDCAATARLPDQEVPPPLTAPTAPATPATLLQPEDRPLPINLATALHLANVRAVDIAVAAERVQVAAALLEQARVLWLPTLTVGGDYNRHDGRNQDTTGRVFDNSRSSGMLGVGTGTGIMIAAAFRSSRHTRYR